MIPVVKRAPMSLLFHQSPVSPPAWVSTPLRVGQTLLLGPSGGAALMVADRVSAVEEGAWLLRFLLALWFGLVGLALERPWKRLVVLVLFGAIHGIAIVAFRL